MHFVIFLPKYADAIYLASDKMAADISSGVYFFSFSKSGITNMLSNSSEPKSYENNSFSLTINGSSIFLPINRFTSQNTFFGFKSF